MGSSKERGLILIKDHNIPKKRLIGPKTVTSKDPMAGELRCCHDHLNTSSNKVTNSTTFYEHRDAPPLHNRTYKEDKEYKKLKGDTSTPGMELGLLESREHKSQKRRRNHFHSQTGTSLYNSGALLRSQGGS